MSGGGRTAGTFWIDSNGRVTQVEITESEPPGVFDYATVRNFTGRTYAPTPENALPEVTLCLSVGLSSPEPTADPEREKLI